MQPDTAYRQSMIPPITDSLINDVIQTENMVRAGQGYWRQGSVFDLAIDDELGVISAKVRGSARRWMRLANLARLRS